EDYYVTPSDIGYGPVVKVDPDFIDREALEKIADKAHRRKVTLAWNADDVAKVCRSMLEPGIENYKYIDLPLSNYASANYDAVLKNGKLVGFSMFAGYSFNERQMLSLATVDPDVQIGDVLTLVWGEPEPSASSGKTAAER